MLEKRRQEQGACPLLPARRRWPTSCGPPRQPRPLAALLVCLHAAKSRDAHQRLPEQGHFMAVVTSAPNPTASTASAMVASSVTSGSNSTCACSVRRATWAPTTPRAALSAPSTAPTHAPHVIPSMVKVAVESLGPAPTLRLERKTLRPL